MCTKVVLSSSKEGEFILKVHSDGEIRVHLPNTSYILLDNYVRYTNDIAYLLLSANEGTRYKFMLPLQPSEESKAIDFFMYWGQDKLKELKIKKLDRFFDYWNHILDYVNRSLDGYKVKIYYRTWYEVCSWDNTSRLGLDILVSFGDSWDNDYSNCNILTENLLSEQVERNVQGLDEDYLFSAISVEFKPYCKSKGDFVEF